MTRRGSRNALGICAAALTLALLIGGVSPSANAQDFAEDREATAQGGGFASSGPYLLGDTTGQTCVGVAASADYADDGGFWAGMGDAPVAMQDTLARKAGRTAKIAVATLLANDADPNHHWLALTRVDAVSARGGTVQVVDGWVLYLPPPDLNDTDDFTYTITNADGSTATGSVLVQVLPSGGTSPPRTLVRVQSLPDGSVTLWFVGIAGRTYSIQACTDLTEPEWETLAVRQAGPNGLFEFTDTAQPQPPQRFYRAVTE